MASSKKYEVEVSTKVDQKALDTLIKRLDKLKTNVNLGINVDPKVIKKLEADIKKLVKPLKLDIDTTEAKSDLTAIERQIDRIRAASNNIRTSGGGVGNIAGGVSQVGAGTVSGGSNALLAAGLASSARNTANALVRAQAPVLDSVRRTINSANQQTTVARQQLAVSRQQLAAISSRTQVALPPGMAASLAATPPRPTPIPPPATPQRPTPIIPPIVPTRGGTGAGAVGGALIGMEVFEKFNFLMTTVATNYETVANKIQDTNSDLADSLRTTATNIKDTTKIVQGVASGGILGSVLGGAKGGVLGAAAGGGLAIAMKYFSEYQDTMIEVTRSEANLQNTHTKLTEAFQELQFARGQKMLDSYNKTLQDTIDLENELTSVKLHSQDEELARQYDLLQLELQRIENQKKLIEESQIPESQKIVEIDKLTAQQDFLKNQYDIQAAGAPVEKLQIALSGLSDTFTPIVEALGKSADDLNSVKNLTKRLTEVDSILGDASNVSSKLAALDTRETDIRTKPQFMRGVFGTSSQRAEKDRLALEEIATERVKLLKLQEEGKGLTEERNKIKEELKKYATEEQLQQEIETLQQQKDSLQKSINAKGLELDMALTTQARVEQNIAETAALRNQSRGIDKVSQLANAPAPAGLQARLDADLATLNEKLGNVSGMFDRLRTGASVGKQGGLTTLESAITQAIKDGIVATPEFVGIIKQATGLGITGDTEFKQLLQSLYDIAKVQQGGNKILPAARQALEGADVQVAEYIKKIIGDREINAQELAGLQELLANSGQANSEAMNRLIAIAENNLSNQGVVIDRITKIENALKVVNAKLK